MVSLCSHQLFVRREWSEMGVQILNFISAHHGGAHSPQKASPTSPVHPYDPMSRAAFGMAGFACPKNDSPGYEAQQHHRDPQSQEQERIRPQQPFKFGITPSHSLHVPSMILNSSAAANKGRDLRVPSMARFGVPEIEQEPGIVKTVFALPYEMLEEIGE